MASERALAVRRATAMQRLTDAAVRIDPAAAPPAWSKQPEIAALERLEWVADLLDRAAPAAAEHAQLVVTTEIASDLFDQVQEAHTDAPETRRPAPAHQPAAPAGPAEARAAAKPPVPNTQTRRGRG